MKTFSKQLLQEIEKKYKDKKIKIKTGDIINLKYQVKLEQNERPSSFDGLIIAIKNKEISKTFIIRQIKKSYFIDQTFFLNSPKIIKIEKKSFIKKKRSKLYYLKNI